MSSNFVLISLAVGLVALATACFGRFPGFDSGNNPVSSPAIDQVTLGNYIAFSPQSGREEALRSLLKQAGSIVAKTEPDTVLWYALENERNGSFAVLDFFTDEDGQSAQFSGQVAGILQENAGDLVAGGWDQGVVPGIQSYKVLAPPVQRRALRKAKLAVYLPLYPKPGQEQALAELLQLGRDLVDESEPDTLLWVPLQNEEGTDFAIVDLFKNEAGIEAHLAGSTAAALQSQADTLLEGGWAGVTAGIQVLHVLSSN